MSEVEQLRRERDELRGLVYGLHGPSRRLAPSSWSEAAATSTPRAGERASSFARARASSGGEGGIAHRQELDRLVAVQAATASAHPQRPEAVSTASADAFQTSWPSSAFVADVPPTPVGWGPPVHECRWQSPPRSCRASSSGHRCSRRQHHHTQQQEQQPPTPPPREGAFRWAARLRGGSRRRAPSSEAPSVGGGHLPQGSGQRPGRLEGHSLGSRRPLGQTQRAHSSGPGSARLSGFIGPRRPPEEQLHRSTSPQGRSRASAGSCSDGAQAPAPGGPGPTLTAGDFNVDHSPTIAAPAVQGALERAMRGLGTARGTLADAAEQIGLEAEKRSAEAWRLRRLQHTLVASVAGLKREVLTLREAAGAVAGADCALAGSSFEFGSDLASNDHVAISAAGPLQHAQAPSRTRSHQRATPRSRWP